MTLARRTTLAVAGLAALGTGAAAPAFAVPALPPVASPTAITNPAAAHAVSGTPSSLSDLPDPFAFEMPNVRAYPAAPTVDPEVESSTRQFGTDSALQQLDGMSSDADQ